MSKSVILVCLFWDCHIKALVLVCRAFHQGLPSNCCCENFGDELCAWFLVDDFFARVWVTGDEKVGDAVAAGRVKLETIP
jgi:hypothetical protein